MKKGPFLKHLNAVDYFSDLCIRICDLYLSTGLIKDFYSDICESVQFKLALFDLFFFFFNKKLKILFIEERTNQQKRWMRDPSTTCIIFCNGDMQQNKIDF